MKRHNISKNDILKKIYLNLGIPVIFSGKILELILQTIIEGLNKITKLKYQVSEHLNLEKKNQELEEIL